MLARTSNDAEQFHSLFASLIGLRKSPMFYYLLDDLLTISEMVSASLESINAGLVQTERVKRPMLKYQEREALRKIIETTPIADYEGLEYRLAKHRKFFPTRRQFVRDEPDDDNENINPVEEFEAEELRAEGFRSFRSTTSEESSLDSSYLDSDGIEDSN